MTLVEPIWSRLISRDVPCDPARFQRDPCACSVDSELNSCLALALFSTQRAHRAAQSASRAVAALPKPWRLPSPTPSPLPTISRPPPFLPHPLLDLRHRPADPDLPFPLPTRPSPATQAASSAVLLSQRPPSLLPGPQPPHGCTSTLWTGRTLRRKARPLRQQPRRPSSPRSPTRDRDRQRRRRRPRSLMTRQSRARARR